MNWVQALTVGDRIALANLAFTVITTIAVLCLAYIALGQTARPKIAVRLHSPKRGGCRIDQSQLFVFEVVNVGHWYGSPIAVDVTLFVNFSPQFELIELRFGSVQELVNTDVRVGKCGMPYLKAHGLKLSRSETGEEVHVLVRTPRSPGKYRVRATAYSANDAHFTKDFIVRCAEGSKRAIREGPACGT